MPVDSDAESIKTALTSSATCTSATLETLTCLLNEGTINKRTATTRTKPNSKSRVKNVPSAGVPPISTVSSELPPSARVKLATEVINICLKALSRAAQTGEQRSKTTSPQKKTPSTEPLKARSLNIPTNAPKLTGSDNADGQEDGVLVVAECARTALGALRRHNDQHKSQALPELQLESAMSATIAKLISLEMSVLASKEVHILAKRLEMGQQEDLPPRKAAQDGMLPLPTSTRSLMELLHLRCLPDSPSRLSLIFTTQMQILHLLRFAKIVPNPLNLYKNLDQATPSSPCNLLDAILAIDGKEKCARLLSGLAHTISSLSDRVSTKLDTFPESKLDLAYGVLQLRMLSLEILNKSWSLAGHKVDARKQLPFRRYVESYLSQSAAPAEDRFKVIDSTLKRFMTIVEKMGLSKQQKLEVESIRLDVDQMLYKLSRSAGNHKQSKDLAARTVSSLPQVGVSEVRKGLLFCQLATTMVQDIASVTKEEACQALTQAIQFYSSTADGSSEDLDELLASSSNLRKAAITVLTRNSLTQDTLRENELFCLLRDCVLKSPTFVLQYLGKPPLKQTNSKANQRYAKRKSLASIIGQATIESVAALARLCAQSTPAEWKTYEQSLMDCQTLQKHLGIECSDTEKKPEKRYTPLLVLLSNAYWHRYLFRRKENHTTEMISLLEKSVALLQESPAKHQELGLLPIKLERLAYLQEQKQNWEVGAKSYRRLFEHLCQSQLVQLAAERFRWTPALASLLEDDNFKLIGKAIGGFCRTSRRLNSLDVQSLFSDELSSNLRGFIIELHLAYLRKHEDEAGDCLQHVFEQLGRELLDIYTEASFPIRRIRALGSLAQCHVFLDTEQNLSDNMHELDGEERTLLPFHGHLIARRNAILAMTQIKDSKLLATALKQWQGLINCKSIVNQETLLKKIDDVQEWLHLLSNIVNFTDAHGLSEQRVTALDLLTYLAQIPQISSPEAFVTNASYMVNELVELGLPDQAHSLLMQSKSRLSEVPDQDAFACRWQIAQANFSIKFGNKDAAEAAILAAGLCSTSVTNSDKKLRSIEIAHSQAQCHYISAKHHFISGNVIKSTYHVRQSISLLLQAWATIERKHGKLNDVNTNTVDGKDQSTKFWSLVRPLFESLLEASTIYSHTGLISKSRYYILEAIKIAEAVSAPILKKRALLVQSAMEMRSGDRLNAKELCGQAQNILHSCRSLVSLQAALLNVEYAIQASECSEENGIEKLDEAYDLINKLAPMRLMSLQSQRLDFDEIARTMENLEISTSKRARLGADIAKAPRSTKRLDSRSAADTSAKHNQEVKRLPYVEQKRRLLLTKLMVLMNEKKYEEAMATKEQDTDLTCGFQGQIQQALVSAKLQAEQGLILLELDPVFNIIPQAILSQPSAVIKDLAVKPAEQERSTRRGKATPAIQKQDASKYAMHFDLAVKCVNLAQSMPQGIPSVLEAHMVTDLSLKYHLALGALTSSSKSPHDPTKFLIKQLEYGKSYACALEHATIQADKMLRLTPGGQFSTEFDAVSEVDQSTDDLEHFKSEYIDIIPPNWHVVSISLSEDHQDLRLGSLKSQTEPLILSIPLDRRTNDGGDMEFTFDHGKKELLQIINTLNRTSDEGVDLYEKRGKAEWWTTRAALDSRLRDLLVNIENIWIGGFKGILKHCSMDISSTAKFELAFVKILDKHLPSRQVKRGQQKKTPVRLDTQIVELFIRLGHPGNDKNIDESILDLLWFIVDILWFNGESNVCDEIDFDPMVLEIRDALSNYHETVNSKTPEHADRHTILILDKRLHSFPWESLPCMEGQSVCRLPSLYLLRQRILKMQEDSSKPRTAFTIDATDGAYILNPSGDLKQCSATLQQPLSTLSTWSSIIDSEPSESDLATALSTKSLYLYNGHSSGCQYINPRTVRRLDRCAVALLMGCKSVALTEAGDFESHGTLLDYLHAGSPAVVGALWNVTDGDVSRLSLKMLQRWGLFEDSTREQKVPLDTAIAQARSSCIMRYLNGAAIVVYGIPVSLK